MSEIDRLLDEAGARWRAAQPEPPTPDPAVFVVAARRRTLRVAVAGTAVLTIVAVGLLLAQLGTWRSSNVGGLGTAVPGTGGATPEVPSCEPTRPTPPFVPPAGYLPTPPATYQAEWFGSADLWTMLRRDGEVWAASTLPRDRQGLSQKLFWWSSRWDPDTEPEPAISVMGRRLDGAARFEVDRGTNAMADFGVAMLVGAEIPGPGCWQITGRFRDAELSYVILITDD